jgi:hypothetical protein
LLHFRMGRSPSKSGTEKTASRPVKGFSRGKVFIRTRLHINAMNISTKCQHYGKCTNIGHGDALSSARQSCTSTRRGQGGSITPLPGAQSRCQQAVAMGCT